MFNYLKGMKYCCDSMNMEINGNEKRDHVEEEEIHRVTSYFIEYLCNNITFIFLAIRVFYKYIEEVILWYQSCVRKI